VQKKTPFAPGSINLGLHAMSETAARLLLRVLQKDAKTLVGRWLSTKERLNARRGFM